MLALRIILILLASHSVCQCGRINIQVTVPIPQKVSFVFQQVRLFQKVLDGPIVTTPI